MLLKSLLQALTGPLHRELQSGAAGGSLPMLTTTADPTKALSDGNGVDAQDMTELRRMTCPVGALYEHCPNLKALAVDCRQRHLYGSTSDLVMRRHSADGPDSKGRAYWLRLAKSCMIGGYNNLKARLSLSNDMDFLNEARRHLIVEYVSNEKRKCKSSEDISYAVSREVKAHEKNISTSFVILSLKEGRLTAEISLEELPDDEDIIIRVRNFTLELYTQKRSFGKKGTGKLKDGTKTEGPQKCGKIDIPIYLDPSTLWFELIDDHTVIMEGNTKTSLPRPVYQNSHEEVKCSNNNVSKGRSSPDRRQANATWYVNGQSERPSFYRQRSYTR